MKYERSCSLSALFYRPFIVFCLCLVCLLSCTTLRFPLKHLLYLLFAIKDVKVDTSQLHSFCHFLNSLLTFTACCLQSTLFTWYSCFFLWTVISWASTLLSNQTWCFSQFLQADARIVSQIGPWLLTSRSFSISYLLITLLVNAVQIELLTVWLNKPWTNK